jgi:dolichol-phosphate mannosyltransferase
VANRNSFSLIVPTYKERDNIVPLVERIHKALAGYNYKVLFIDDDSNDGTAELVRALSERYPLEVIVRKDKRGLASAVVDGIGYAEGDIIGVMDADLQHPPEVLPDLVKAIENGAEMAIASRYVPGGSCEGWGLLRRINSRGAIFIAHVLLPLTRKIKDPMAGFFVFKKQAIAGADLKPTGYKILLEILMEGKFQNIAEVPFTFKTRSRGQSKLNVRQQIDYLKHIYSLMRRTGELLRFVKFCVVGASGVGVNLGILTALTEVAGLHPRYSSAVAIEVSIITNFLFNNYWTFRDRSSAKTESTIKRLGKFNLVSLAGAGINWGIFNLFYEVVDLHYIAAQFIGIAVATLWNYTFSTWWTWR